MANIIDRENIYSNNPFLNKMPMNGQQPTKVAFNESNRFPLGQISNANLQIPVVANNNKRQNYSPNLYIDTGISHKNKKVKEKEYDSEQLNCSFSSLNLSTVDNEDIRNLDMLINQENDVVNRLSEKEIIAQKNNETFSFYDKEIFEYLKSIEMKNVCNCDYMSKQQVTVKMRVILIDWLSEIHWLFNLSDLSLFLAVNIFDRFLSFRLITKSKLQLIGCCSLLIASKYFNEQPLISDFCYISQDDFTFSQIVFMEEIILKDINFSLSVPLSMAFLTRIIYKLKEDIDPVAENYVYYLLHLTLLSYNHLKYEPSLLAASVLYLGLYIYSINNLANNNIIREILNWGDDIVELTGYSLVQINKCINETHIFLLHLPIEQTDCVLFKKFSSKKRCSVSKIFSIPHSISL